MNSIQYRIAGLVFLSITITVVVLVFLANYQMMLHFETYLFMQGMHGGGPFNRRDGWPRRGPS